MNQIIPNVDLLSGFAAWKKTITIFSLGPLMAE